MSERLAGYVHVNVMKRKEVVFSFHRAEIIGHDVLASHLRIYLRLKTYIFSCNS
jgi:hypothetical protein